MSVVLPDGMKWCALHNETFPIGYTCQRCYAEAVRGLNLTSCDFVGDDGCSEPTCQRCHRPRLPMTAEALKLAREWLVQNECENVNPLTFGEGISLLAESGIHTLARCVIAQAEELERVKTGLREALNEWSGLLSADPHRGSAMHARDVSRCAELRKLAMP